MYLSQLKIGTRLGFGFALVILLMLGIAAVGITSLNINNETTSLIVSDRYVKADLSNDLRTTVNRGARDLRNALLSGDPDKEANYLDRIKESSKSTNEILAKLKGLLASEQGQRLFNDIVAAQSTYQQGLDRVVKSIEAGNKYQATVDLMNDVIPLEDAYFATIRKMVQFQGQQMNDGGKEAASVGDTAVLTMAALAAVAAAIAIGFGFFITRSITRPVTQAVDLAEAVARGDLTAKIDVNSTDETGRLLAALRKMNENLVGIVSEVRSGTDTIATASGQIASGNLDLSSRTEQQASALEETASSMEELTSTVRQNADNARQANGLAMSASEIANKGGEVVAQVVDTMGAINDSARKIVDIISVIDGIAFQTNILALNAAVEAARAGEQGRGFAVVAAEVRSLAQRSASAAKEIKTLIDNSVEKVETGSKLVDQAGATMREIVDGVKRVTDIMSEITAASHEQSSGIEQVNQAIAQMDQATQQNASLVEEAAAAAQSLEDQAGKLVQVVSVFTLSQQASAQTYLPPGKKPAQLTGGRKRSIQGATSGASTPQKLVHASMTADEEMEAF